MYSAIKLKLLFKNINKIDKILAKLIRKKDIEQINNNRKKEQNYRSGDVKKICELLCSNRFKI